MPAQARLPLPGSDSCENWPLWWLLDHPLSRMMGPRKGPMLSRLSIRDIVLIDRLDIDFADGLAVLTGETCAGKSILLDAFVLALGARGDQALIRQGGDQGQGTAALEVGATHPARALLEANDIAAEDELVLRRVQFADGRTRA